MMLESFWAIALGGAVGALLRGSLLRLRMTTQTPPTGRKTPGDPASRATLAANLLGCFVLGLWIAMGGDLPVWLSALIVTGFCGGLTTFSALIADFTRLSEAPRRASAFGYLALTFGGGLMAVWLGIRLGTQLAAA